MSPRILRLLGLAPLMSAAAELASGGGGATPSPTPTGATPTPSATPTPTASNDMAWLGADTPPELMGYAQNKGWKNPRELLDGYKNLEKLVGEQRIALPKDEKDEAAWGKLYDSMGRPKAPADYKLPVPEGHDPKFAGAAADVFHKAGLSAKQATTVATWWNELTAKAEKEQQTARETRQAQELEQVKGEWGGAYDERKAVAQRAMRVFGIDVDAATKIEESMGSKWLMNFMYTIGNALTEHKAEGGEGAGGGMKNALTPEQAKAEIERLKADPEFRQKYTNNNVDAKARMDQLHKWAYPS